MIAPLDHADDIASKALNLLNCGVIVIDAKNCVLLWNRWMVSRSGRSAARVRDQSLFDIFPELDGSRVEAAVLAARTDGISGNIPASQGSRPFPLREAGSLDGERIDQAISVSPFKEGSEYYCVIEIRDVSGTMVRERQMLEHAESLRARAHVDGLTGIYNRRYFDLSMERELRRAQRNGGEMSLLLMDIDSFKAYNDFFGHQQGDTCLVTVAQEFAAMLKRPADVAARYGGEEFAAVLPDTSADQARVLAEKIREHIASLALEHAPAAAWPQVTLSIGVASFSSEGNNNAAALIESADRALYTAKRGGRNRVSLDVEQSNAA